MSLFGDFPYVPNPVPTPEASSSAGIHVSVPEFQHCSQNFSMLSSKIEENTNCLKKLHKKFKGKSEKSFLHKVGDAFCKALPTILITLSTAVIGYIFKSNPNTKAFQPA